MSSSVEATSEVRPFHVDIPDKALEDLRRRIAAMNWPEKETVADQSQGVPLATLQALARYWAPSTTGARSRPASTPCRSS
jgi:Epoxide hydrolase N terminus